ncbi:dihydroneopterin aldolase [Campylobacter blaseri]|uniref:Dihydroneopterin aldolase n=1 Tax=Campylobacter blaseri TaxID=2042961 RepID=A0A2P8R182_9BACT|nr:FolB domain-containing protein [Campylobacter blaseri]PSM52249.1 dihydroneopterin aldolase [Campylobacter blaseri]PSM54015.1 dihydroneopterin aldolase [Campylobacter blaseri]QKF85453.1 dihydroneopterin aldolase [Campylobacter blaseri]
MITVLVENLEFKTIIGILDFERKKKQKIIVSVKFQAGEFIDYADVCKYIKKSFKKQKFMKVEDALEFFEAKFKKKYKSLTYLHIKIMKKEIIKSACVGASLENYFN